MDEKAKAELRARAEQREAWLQFAKDHPIAARKAKQRAEEEARRHTRINLSFGELKLTARE